MSYGKRRYATIQKEQNRRSKEHKRKGGPSPKGHQGANRTQRLKIRPAKVSQAIKSYRDRSSTTRSKMIYL